MDDILKYRNILIAVFIVAVFCTLNYSIFSHYTEEFVKLDKKIEELKEGKVTIVQWESFKKAHQALMTVFLSGDPAGFKIFAEAHARDSNIQISSINMSRKDEKYYWLAELIFEASGYYRDFVDFIELMERKKISMTTITLTNEGRNAGDDGELYIRCALSGVIIK
jgi:hypothetical protein